MARKKTEVEGTTSIDTIEKEKDKAVQSAIEQIKKKYGDGAIMTMNGAKLDVEALSTGSMTLDLALGVGGIPKGRIVEIFGPESCGKTTVCLEIVANVQAQGGKCAYIDVENAMDPAYAKNLNVDLDKLLISQPNSGEQAMDIMESLVKSGGLDVIVLDSVAAMVTEAEIEGEVADQGIGLLARLMSKSLKRLINDARKNGTTLIFCNQLRDNINAMGYGAQKETTSGGRALKFYASVRIDMRRIKTIKDKQNVAFANRTQAKIVKNKVASPHKVAEFEIVYGKGIDKLGEIIDLAVEHKIIKKGGAWFSYQGNNVGQGAEATKTWLSENPEILNTIRKQLNEILAPTEEDLVVEETNAVEVEETNDGFDV